MTCAVIDMLLRVRGCAAAIVLGGTMVLTVAITAPAHAEETDVSVAELREVRAEFADVSQTLTRQGQDLTSLVTTFDQWAAGMSGTDPGTGQPWTDVMADRLAEAQADVSRMRTESKEIGETISNAFSALHNGNQTRAFRVTQSVAVLLNRLTDDAASSGKNITMTLGAARPLLEKVGNGSGLQRIAASLQVQSALMRDLRQTENAIPSNAFPDVIHGEVEPAEVKKARDDVKRVSSSLDRTLTDIAYLVDRQHEWSQGSQAVDPGSGQPWAAVLGHRLEASRADLQRLDLQSDTIAASLTRAFRSARKDNEGGVRLALRTTVRDLQQLSRDAEGVGSNLRLTLASTRPLLGAVGDTRGLQKIADSVQQMTTLYSRIQKAQQDAALDSIRRVP